MLNKKFYDEHPIFHHYPKYLINVQPIQAANRPAYDCQGGYKFFLFLLEVIHLRL